MKKKNVVKEAKASFLKFAGKIRMDKKILSMLEEATLEGFWFAYEWRLQWYRVSLEIGYIN
jgi:hypothetical protein